MKEEIVTAEINDISLLLKIVLMDEFNNMRTKT